MVTWVTGGVILAAGCLAVVGVSLRAGSDFLRYDNRTPARVIHRQYADPPTVHVGEPVRVCSVVDVRPACVGDFEARVFRPGMAGVDERSVFIGAATWSARDEAAANGAPRCFIYPNTEKLPPGEWCLYFESLNGGYRCGAAPGQLPASEPMHVSSKHRPACWTIEGPTTRP